MSLSTADFFLLNLRLSIPEIPNSDPEQARRFVGHDLDQDGLQMQQQVELAWNFIQTFSIFRRAC